MPKPKRRRSPAASFGTASAVPPPSAGPSRLRYILAAIALCLLTLCAYSNSFTTGFALDGRALLSDPRIQKATAGNVGLILRHSYWWPNGEAGIYRPFATLTYLFNYAILGNEDRSAGYHWVNFFLHSANVLLVFALIRRLLPGHARAFQTAFLVAILWAAHPLLTESVTNLAGRPDLLAAASILGGFLIYLKSCEAKGLQRGLWLAGLGIAAALGAFSKEGAVVLPGVIVLYELTCGRRKRMRGALRACIATLLPIGLMLGVRTAVLSASPPAEFPFVDNPIVGAGFWIARLTATKVLARYLWLAFWPVKLSSDYSYSEIPLAHGSPEDWTSWVALIIATAVVAFFWKRNRLAFFFACFGFLNLLPASNLFFPIGTIMAERLMYLPLVGLLASIAIAIDPRGSLPLGFLCLIVAALGVRTWTRNLDWTNDLTMATATVETSPGSFKSHRLLAAAIFESDPTHASIDRALAEADKSVAILSALPDERSVPEPWNLAATCHLAKGDALPPNQARSQFERAAQLALRAVAVDKASRAAYDRRHGTRGAVPPGAAEGYRILASAYLRLNQPEPALSASSQARTINPANAEAYGEMADAYLALRRGEDAAIALSEGMFATGDHSLREDLVKLYQSGVDTQGCAVIAGPRGPALNPSCPIVLRDLCEGTVRAHREDLGQQLSCPNQSPDQSPDGLTPP